MNDEIKQCFNLMLGRLSALQVGLWVIAASLPPEIKQIAEAKMAEATEHVLADALALPLPEQQLEEMMRLMRELPMILGVSPQEPG